MQAAPLRDVNWAQPPHKSEYAGLNMRRFDKEPLDTIKLKRSMSWEIGLF